MNIFGVMATTSFIGGVVCAPWKESLIAFLLGLFGTVASIYLAHNFFYNMEGVEMKKQIKVSRKGNMNG